MLIDELLAAKVIQNLPQSHIDKMKVKLRKAVKFDLAIDFASAAETLATDFDTIANAIPFCRLPFNMCWVEVAQTVRPRFHSATVHFPTIQQIPKRVGFLLEAESDKLSKFRAHQFWSFPHNDTVHVSEIAMVFSPDRMRTNAFDEVDGEDHPNRILPIDPDPKWLKSSFETRSKLVTVIQPILPDFPPYSLSLSRDKEAVQILYEISVADWSGESVFLLGVLALLNTVNAHERTISQLSKLNKSRVKSGKLPLQDYYTLKISKRLKERFAGDGSNHYGELRWHLVRGHWKVRKTGIFFWKDFARGNKKVGIIEKDYQL